MKSSSIYLGLLLLLASFSCTKESKVDPLKTLKQVYSNFKFGEISEAELNGKLVHVASLNAFDSQAVIYAQRGGELLGECNYWIGGLTLCDQLKNQKVIYRCENHISGQPAVDLYGLGN